MTKCPHCSSLPCDTLKQPHEWGAHTYQLIQVTYTCGAVYARLDNEQGDLIIGCSIEQLEEQRYDSVGA